MRLYDICAGYRQWAERITDLEGEVTPEDLAEIDKIDAAFEDKAEAYAVIICEFEAEEAALKSEIERLTKRAANRKKQAEWLKGRLSSAMTDLHRERLSTSKFSLSFRKSTSVAIDDETVLPDEFWKVERRPMKAEIKAAINAGREVPGCHIETEQHVQIK